MIKQKHIKRLNKIFNDLNSTMEEIREYIPEANLFFYGRMGGISVNLHTKKYNPSPSGDDKKWFDSNVYDHEIKFSDCGGY